MKRKPLQLSHDERSELTKIAETKYSRIAKRATAILMGAEDMTIEEIASRIDVPVPTVRRWFVTFTQLPNAPIVIRLGYNTRTESDDEALQLTLTQASQKLNLGYERMRLLVRSGAIRSTGEGKNLRVPLFAIHEWIESNTR